VAERNLNRITIAVALIWIASVVGIGVLIRFS
jgi:preprotein translocase subunit SecG